MADKSLSQPSVRMQASVFQKRMDLRRVLLNVNHLTMFFACFWAIQASFWHHAGTSQVSFDVVSKLEVLIRGQTGVQQDHGSILFHGLNAENVLSCKLKVESVFLFEPKAATDESSRWLS